MLSLDKKLADKIGDNFIIAHEGSGTSKKPIFAITSNYLKCRPCIFPDRPDKLLEREDWLRFIRKYRLSNADVRKLRSTDPRCSLLRKPKPTRYVRLQGNRGAAFEAYAE